MPRLLGEEEEMEVALEEEMEVALEEEEAGIIPLSVLTWRVTFPLVAQIRREISPPVTAHRPVKAQ